MTGIKVNPPPISDGGGWGGGKTTNPAAADSPPHPPPQAAGGIVRKGGCYNPRMTVQKTESESRLDRVEKVLAAVAEDIRLLMEERRKEAAAAAKRSKEVDKQLAEAGRIAAQTNKTVGNYTNGEGMMLEDECLAALRKVKSIGGIAIDEFFAGVRIANGQAECEYDIVGLNPAATVVVEVKRALRPEGVRDFAERRLPQFKRVLKKYSRGKKIVGVMMFKRALTRKEVPADEEEPIALALRAGLILLQLTAKNEIKQITKPPAKGER